MDEGCFEYKGVGQAAYKASYYESGMRFMNEIIAATLASITSCVRFGGESAPGLSYGMRSLSEIASLLVPKPSMKFIAPALFPLFSRRIHDPNIYSH